MAHLRGGLSRHNLRFLIHFSLECNGKERRTTGNEDEVLEVEDLVMGLAGLR